jgi:hypothetical protein
MKLYNIYADWIVNKNRNALDSQVFMNKKHSYSRLFGRSGQSLTYLFKTISQRVQYSILLNRSRKEIMKSYRCLKKNSIVDLVKNPENFNPELTPCIKSECALWNGGDASNLQNGKKIILFFEISANESINSS